MYISPLAPVCRPSVSNLHFDATGLFVNDTSVALDAFRRIRLLPALEIVYIL